MFKNRMVLTGLLTLLVLTEAVAFGDATITVREKTVVGHELRVVVETSRTVDDPLSSNQITKDVKCYLIIVDLASELPTGQRSRVFGPLYDVPQPRSELSFSAGANFAKEDIAAALSTPHCAFDDNGCLVRFRNDLAHQKVIFDRLDLVTATYKQSTTFSPINDEAGPMSEDRVICPSGRYMLLYQDGVTRLYDLYTGQEKNDPWLTARFTESRQIPKFENVNAYLTDDLDHLVVSPKSSWNEAPGLDHQTFDFHGKTYSRANYFLCTDRPEPNLGIVQRKDEEPESLEEAPNGALTIDKQLMLMFTSQSTIRLYRRDGTVVYHSEEAVPSGWANGTLGTTNMAAEGKLVFFNVDLNNEDQVMNRHIALIIWDYRHGLITSYIVPIIDLFKESGGGYFINIQPIPVN
jgi:hypothetical protein